MAKDPLLPDSPGTGDSWESLASNLLGINLNQSADGDIVSEADLDALESEVSEPAPAVENSVSPDQSVQPKASETVEEAIHDDGADAAQSAAVADSDSTDAADEFSEDAAPSAMEASDAEQTSQQDDPYWDPLAAWEWDDAGSGKSRATGTRKTDPRPQEFEVTEKTTEPELAAENDGEEDSLVKGPGTDARRAADTFDTVTDYRDEYNKEDDWEFGAGLLEGVSPPPKEPQAPEKKPPRHRQRRPARTSVPSIAPEETRREESADRVEPATNPSLDSKTKHTETDAEKPPPSVEAHRDAADDDDVFGAGLVDSDASVTTESRPEETERRPRRRGRRRGRSRKTEGGAATDEARESKTTAELPQTPIPKTDDDDDDDADDQSEQGSESESTYGNVPTWEEAISYLVHAGRSSGSPSESSSAESKAASSSKPGSGKSPRSSGGRRRRR